MGFWGGMFFKHRDYLHGSFFEHEMDNGGSYDVAENTPVTAVRDPASMEPLNSERTVYPVRLNLHDGSSYDYFVPADDNGHFPNREEIKREIDKQASTRLPEGVVRDPEVFLSPGSYMEYLSIVDQYSAWNSYQN